MWFLIAGVAVAAVLGLGLLAYLGAQQSKSPPTAGYLDPAQAPIVSNGKFPYKVGQPKPGEQAPALRLPSTRGGTFDLASQAAGSTLVYFQEGIMCEPCWTQIKDIQAKWSSFQTLGLTQMVTITTDPIDALNQKVADEGITFPALSDSDVSASRAYGTLGYGMMGANANGHTFFVVGANGMIRWRADYGAPPHMFMDIPVADLLADMRKGLGEAVTPAPSG